MRRAIAEASRACCGAVAERRLRGHVSEASQGNRRGGTKARVVVRGIGKSDRGAAGVTVEASRGVAEASQRRDGKALLHEQSEE